ncbi:tRNA pseudouridine(38-40) synthase TruA [Arcanobacterium wilhelmae]|uniref:tRNA pseudouridine(38-40) synthase TruA n=1 Tax=Arcanobacterium wilhelmae TaxID=1803177 RepID=UPI00241575F0|nr:tRNA pseudouridine(38-40) synthase TruA [Arcanobacterium wilhelmae]WFN90749.1 tRNA pseudouridine(38-40) synthase TruA [Arcanobacterium wilhelmae]
MVSTVSHTARIRIECAYDGAQFHGWAAQPGLRTVQGVLEDALATILREPITLTVAGRTDAGVHAAGQVAHFDVSRERWEALPGRSTFTPGDSLVRRVNAITAAGSREAGIAGYTDVVVKSAREVPETFDARFSALWRAYTYRMAEGPDGWDPKRRDVLWLPGELDIDAMNRAAQRILGEHDFLSYCRPREGASTVRTLHELRFERAGGLLLGYARADAFCHSQVRTLMGTMIEVGRGVRGEEWPLKRLEASSRDGEVIVAPPHPLTLEEIGYPPESEYGTQAQLARRFRGPTS